MAEIQVGSIFDFLKSVKKKEKFVSFKHYKFYIKVKIYFNFYVDLIRNKSIEAQNFGNVD